MSGAAPAGSWHTLLFTSDGTSEKLYIDGSTTPNASSGGPNSFANAAGRYPIRLGGQSWWDWTNPNDCERRYNGALGSLQIWEGAVNAADVPSLTAAIAPITPTLYTMTATLGTGATISPVCPLALMTGESMTFTISVDVFNKITNVSVDGVSQGTDPVVALTGVTTDHHIEVTTHASTLVTVSGKVTNKVGSGIENATVYFSGVPNASVTSFATATTTTGGVFVRTDVPEGIVYVSAAATGCWNSADKVLAVAGATSGVNVTLQSNTRNIPADGMWFSVISDSLPASGATGAWTPYLPNPSIAPIQATYTTMGSPVVEYVDNMKWERNDRGISDSGFYVGKYAAGDPTTGLSIVAAVRPIYNNPAIGGEPRGEIVDIGYSELWLAVLHDTGAVQICRRGYAVSNTGYTIPNGQKTILSLIVTAPSGLMTLYANGTQVWQLASGVDYSSLSFNLDTKLSIGRNAWDGWSAFNGNIGDVFVYKKALSDEERTALQSDLGTKFGITVVGPTPTDPYDIWLALFTFAPDADTKPTGDPDGDGMNNQQEYAFGLDPTKGSSCNPIRVPFDRATGTFSYTRLATPTSTGLAYSVWTSTNLGSWTQDLGATEGTVTTAGGVETVPVTISPALLNAPKLFVRVIAE